jgi:cytoskeletal protein CcmA (bactofilin family)
MRMALSGFGKTKETETSAPTGGGSSGSSSSGGFGNLTAFIDQGSEFEGKLSFKDTVRIDGCFSGEISSQNTLIVGESGIIEADIDSPTVVINGSVTGNVTATKKLVLHKSARMVGNVQTPSLVMEDGASLDGRVDMSGAKGAKGDEAKSSQNGKGGGSRHGGNGNAHGQGRG